MKLSSNHIKRYKEIARILWKYGRSDLVQQMGKHDEIDPKELKPEGDGKTTPHQLADDLEAMGPTYVKASLGQVHSAALRDGRPVVVKVQRPNIRPQIAEDFEVLAEIAAFLDAHTATGRRYRFVTIVEEFRVSIQHELNYEREAQNLITVGENLKDFELIQVPPPVADYSTKCVLTMDYVRGRKITSISPLARLDLDGAELAEALFKAYLQQVLLDGLFHADPHPGNVFLTDDGHIALLDLGMVGHTTPTIQKNLINLLLEVTRNAAENGLRVPGELTLLGKTLLQLDEVGKILDPTFDPNASIRRNVGELMSKRMMKDATQGSIFNSLLEMKDFVSGLPSRLNSIMDAITNQELEVKIKAVDAKLVMEGFQKIANRITTGIVLGALIMGACMLMRVESSFQLLGYPGLAMVCFLLAATGGFGLVITILVKDRRTRKRPPQ